MSRNSRDANGIQTEMQYAETTLMSVVTIILLGLAVYAAIGVGFAIAFVVWGVGRVDVAARNAGPGFRLLIMPGVAALWPLMLRRWLNSPGTST